MTELATTQQGGALALPEAQLIDVLRNSLYPGAQPDSVYLVLDYCKAAGLDPMQKPVHIVPMWDKASGGMRDVIMPGIGLYRTQAARTGQFAGMSEPEFGPMVTESLGGQSITYPEWAKVTVKRVLPNGIIAEFTAVEYWVENYAVKGGKEKSIAPNAMWTKRPRGQIAKCASAQALRSAFPEIGSQPTAEEMEGKSLGADVIDQPKGDVVNAQPIIDAVETIKTVDELNKHWADHNGSIASDLAAHKRFKKACQERRAAIEASAKNQEQVTDVEARDAVSE